MNDLFLRVGAALCLMATQACTGIIEDDPELESRAASGDGLDDIRASYEGIKPYANVTFQILSKIPATKAAGEAGQTAIGIIDAIFKLFPMSDATSGSIQLYDLLGSLSWQTSRQRMEENFARAQAAFESAATAIAFGQTISADSAAFVDSNAAVSYAESPDAMLRVYVPDTEGIREAVGVPEVQNGLQYDWRLGVPTLMKLITMRIMVIAAFDPDFIADGQFNDELRRHREALQTNYDRMRANVKCGLHPPSGCGSAGCIATYVCVNLSTGGKAFNYDKYINEMPFQEAEQLSRREIYREMPLFEMRQMIDTLAAMEAGSPREDGMFVTGTSPYLNGNFEAPDRFLCLDVQWGGTENGTPVWIYGCDGGPAQQWHFDREDAALVNVGSGKCLDVAGINPRQAAGIQIWDCVGNRGQRWSWNRSSGKFINELGTVLDVQWGVGEPETPVWAWEVGPDTSLPQAWVLFEFLP